MPIHKRLLAGVAGFVKGGPLGAAAGFLKKPGTGMAVSRFKGATAFAPGGNGWPGGPQGPDLPPGFPGTVPEPGGRGAVQRFLPFGQTGYTGAPPGYHINKAYLRHIRAKQSGRETQNPFSEPRARNVIVRNRKMNPLNPRALRRANARQVGAVRLMRRVLRGSGYQISRSGFGRKKARR